MKTYYGRSNDKKTPIKIACFDLETDGLGGKVLAASWITEDEDEAHFIGSGDIIAQLFGAMCERSEFQWFAHNAQYDWRYFVDRFIELKKYVQFFSRADNQVFMILIRCEEFSLTMRDSFALFSSSLKEFTRQFAPERQKLSLDFENVTFDPCDANHIAYAKRDVESLCVALKRFDQFLFETFDVRIRATVSSTAVVAWERSLEDQVYSDSNRANENFIREAYAGGYVYLSSTSEHLNCTTYDLNSSYPYQMKTYNYPVGSAINTDLYISKALGIYDVTVRCPLNIRAPILAKRTKKGLVWCTGDFRTVCTSVELEFALSKGYGLLHVHNGLIFTDSCRPFEKFVGTCESVRKQYKGQALETVAKLMQNSLYGKFGTQRERKKFYGSLPDDEIAGCDVWGEFLVRTEIAEDMLCMPVWAVFVTAYARLHLLRAIYQIGPERVLYADTDSITIRGEENSLNIGPNYGQWKIEKRWLRFRARAPKIYAGEQNGGTYGAVKGIPKREWGRQNVLDYVLSGSQQKKVVQYRRLQSFVNTLRKPEHVGEIEASREIGSLFASLSWYADDCGNVYPRPWQDHDSGD